MDLFPSLSSGAVSQYPTQANVGQAVSIIKFLDGSDQRFLSSGQILRRWCIKLSMLSDEELNRLERFFNDQKGTFSTFVFTDPAGNTPIPNCRFMMPQMNSDRISFNSNSTLLWIMETHV